MAPIYEYGTKVIPVDKLTFDVVNGSAELSGFDLGKGVVPKDGDAEAVENIQPDEVSVFLNLPTTKVFVVQTEGEPDKLIAVGLDGGGCALK